MPLLVVSAFLDYLAIFLAFFSLGGFALIGFRIFVKPALKLRAIKEAPPSEGYSKSIIFKVHENARTFTIGQLQGGLSLRLKGIKEKHLVIKIRRELGKEIYNIFLNANGMVYLRAPHTRKFEKIKKRESFTSAELIAHRAQLRLVAKTFEERILHYVDLGLSCEYFFAKSGLEQMEFILELLEIKPSIDMDSRNKNGIYAFKSSALSARKKEERKPRDRKAGTLLYA